MRWRSGQGCSRRVTCTASSVGCYWRPTRVCRSHSKRWTTVCHRASNCLLVSSHCLLWVGGVDHPLTVSQTDYWSTHITFCFIYNPWQTNSLSTRPHKPPGVTVSAFLPLSPSSAKILEVTYKIRAIDIASRYCVNCGNSANTPRNMKMVYTTSKNLNVMTYSHPKHCACGWNHPKYYISWPAADHTPHALTLKEGFL